MLAHAGTHSSNFDENTNATAFSFNVTAYQWGWNYVFPKDIGDLLLGAPRIVGRGHTFVPSGVDAYARLLASARLEYENHMQASGFHTAQHGKSTPNLPLQTLLPVFSDTDAGLPAWANSIPLCRPNHSGLFPELLDSQDPSFAGSSVRVTSALTLTALRALSQSTRILPLLFPEGAGVFNSAPLVLCGQPVTPDSDLGRFFLEACEDLPASATSQQTRLLQLPGMLALVGNRLAAIYQHLTTAYVSSELAPQRGVAGLADHLFSESRPTSGGFEQGFGLALENVNFSSADAAGSTLGQPSVGSGFTEMLAQLPYLSAQDAPYLSSRVSLEFIQARGVGVGSLGGALTKPGLSDFWANTGASATEVSQLARLVVSQKGGVSSLSELLSHLTSTASGLISLSPHCGLLPQVSDTLGGASLAPDVLKFGPQPRLTSILSSHVFLGYTDVFSSFGADLWSASMPVYCANTAGPQTHLVYSAHTPLVGSAGIETAWAHLGVNSSLQPFILDVGASR